MTYNITFIDVIGMLYHVVFHKIEMWSLFSHLMCALFSSNELTSHLYDLFAKQSFYVIAL